MSRPAWAASQRLAAWFSQSCFSAPSCGTMNSGSGGEFRFRRDHLVMPGRHQRRRQHGVVVFGLALAAQPGRAVRAADAARTIILCAVERDQHPPADPAEAVRAAVDPAKLPDRLREHRAQQRRFGRVQHVADVVVAGNSGDAEQAGAVGRLAQLAGWRSWTVHGPPRTAAGVPGTTGFA